MRIHGALIMETMKENLAMGILTENIKVLGKAALMITINLQHVQQKSLRRPFQMVTGFGNAID